MKNTKASTTKKLYAMTIILITIIAILCISCAGIIQAQAEVAESPIGYEQKEYFDITDIDDDYDDSSILVVMDKYTSGFNKSHSGILSKSPFVKAIKDLTSLTGTIKNKLYLNEDSFRQILKIDLKEHSKQNVLNAINDVQKLDGVLWAGVNGYFHLCDTTNNTPNAMSGNLYQQQWGLHDTFGINAPSAWNYSTGSNSIKVGILDTGIANHLDINNNVIEGWNFIDNSNDTNDINGHGTAIAGIIGANGATADGVIGINWNVKLVPLKIMDKDTYFQWSDFASAVTWAIDNDIDILNLSGSGTTSSQAVKSAINNFKGLFVCSAGNDSNDNDTTPYYPAYYSQDEEFSDRVISVGAIDSDGSVSSFSNYGANTVSLFAPGSDIVTTYPHSVLADGYRSDFGGTSAAAPFVAGVAALLYTKYERYLNKLDSEYIAAQVKTTILNNVSEAPRYKNKCVSGGRLNAEKAMKYCQYIPSIMSGSGYYDGWYFWNGRVDLDIEDPKSFGYDTEDVLYINSPTKLKFSMTTTAAFNAVSEIDISMKFTLTNSAGEICNIGLQQAYNHNVTVGIVSNSKFGFCDFTIDTSKLAYQDTYTLTWEINSTRKKETCHYIRSFTFHYDETPAPPAACIADNSLITLSDGSQVAVQDLKGNEELLVWNMKTGTFDTTPILFIDKDARQEYEVTNLYFSDGTSVKVIDEHGFWDYDLNKYVFLRNDADKYIGHWFNKQIVDENGELTNTKVQLTDVKVQKEITSAWSPVTYGHLCYFVNGMLSMPGATSGFINIFDVDPETMKIDETAYLEDIEKYGLFTYEEFAQICPVPETIFDAFGGQYLKVAIGKGLTSMAEIENLISRYSKFWE